MPHAPLGSANRSLCSGLVMTETRFRQAFLLLLVTAISAAFVAMIRAFLLTILLAAIFAGLSYPVYRVGARPARWPQGACGDRDARAVAGAGDGTAAGGARSRRERSAAGHRDHPATSAATRRSAGRVRQPTAGAPWLRSHRAVPGADPHQGRRARGEHERLSLRRALRHHARDGGLHLSLLCLALHDVFLPDRRSGPAPEAFSRTCRSQRPTSNAWWGSSCRSPARRSRARS